MRIKRAGGFKWKRGGEVSSLTLVTKGRRGFKREKLGGLQEGDWTIQSVFMHESHTGDKNGRCKYLRIPHRRKR